MGQSFYRNSQVCVLVFDLSQPESFQDIETWRTTFLSTLNPIDPDHFPFILLGNKSDQENEIKVTKEEIDAYCKEHNNMPYFATSAKEDINLEEAFNQVADLAIEINTKINGEENFVPPKNISIRPKEEQKEGKKCC